MLACAVAAGASVAGQQSQPAPAPPDQQQTAEPQPAQPTFRGGINFVRVDVIATGKDGAAVADLQQGDFEVTEDGKPQKIETFRFIELDGGLMRTSDQAPPRQIRTDADEEVEAARDDVRLFAFFLDDYHVRRGSSMASREEIARFIETQLGPTDMVAVMYPLQPVASVRFTRNHDAIRRAIGEFQGRKFEYEPRNEYEQKIAYYPTEIVEKVRNQVSLSAMESLVSHMGGLKEGRKSLVLVSEGYSNMLPPQMRNPVAAMPGAETPPPTIRTRAATTPTSSGLRPLRASTCRRISGGSTRPPTATTCPSTRSTRAASPRTSSTSTRTSTRAPIATTSIRPWTRCGSWPSRPTAAPS